MRVPQSLLIPDSKPPVPLAELGGTDPEEFLREVVDTLKGFLQEEPEAREVDPGPPSPER